MGSCAVKLPKVIEESKVNRVVFTRTLFESNRQYLKAEVRHEIFAAKDEKAPMLYLERSELYLKRKGIFPSVDILS